MQLVTSKLPATVLRLSTAQPHNTNTAGQDQLETTGNNGEGRNPHALSGMRAHIPPGMFTGCGRYTQRGVHRRSPAGA